MAMKLVVIGGPSRGATYFLQDGENSIGRAENNSVVLPSGQVSKTHCTLSVRNSRVELADAGSANGTFVNGVLVKNRVLQPRDRISVGPFVLELVAQPTRAVAVRPQSVPAGIPQGMEVPAAATADLGAMNQSLQGGGGEQKSLVIRLKHRFDEVVLPVLHDYNERQETATLIIVLFAIFVVLNIGFTIYPILEQSREEVLREAQNKAKYIAQQIDELNRNDVSMGRESVLSVDFAESEPNMREALIVNMEGRILAPAARLNEGYNDPFFLKVKSEMLRDPSKWRPTGKRFPEESAIRVIHPIMVFNKSKQMNAPAALAVTM
ncbi:MAG: FHA domain-containing protein [Bdellovibrionales bacterium]|nr:FHA domain-containing protein [Bdellovibrionales bacterium]